MWVEWTIGRFGGGFEHSTAPGIFHTMWQKNRFIKYFGVIGIFGILVWAAGMLIEIVADRQKSAFKSNPDNKGGFISTGLWAWSRHPNYFGEIVLWTGMAIVALPVLHGWQWATLISPVFVAFLLIKVSGIPLLEAKADERWGGDEDYEAYKRNTPVLVPKPPAVNA